MFNEKMIKIVFMVEAGLISFEEAVNSLIKIGDENENNSNYKLRMNFIERYKKNMIEENEIGEWEYNNPEYDAIKLYCD